MSRNESEGSMDIALFQNDYEEEEEEENIAVDVYKPR